MQFLMTVAAVFVFAFSLIQCGTAKTDATASKTAEPAIAAPEDDAARITLDDAKKAFDAGEAFFVDTRGEAQFKESHIKGAINIPAEAFETRYTEMPKDKKIIAYCS